MTKKIRIALDPGHGGSDGGAIYDGVREADLNLGICRLARTICAASMPGVVVFLTRENDRKIRLSERGKIAAHTDLVISVHCNASTLPSHFGPRIYIWPRNNTAYAVGKKILFASHDQKNVSGRIHTVRRDDPEVDGDEWLNRPYNVVAAYKPTAVLYETAFMSNPGELNMLLSSEGQQIIALAIVRGIAEFSALQS